MLFILQLGRYVCPMRVGPVGEEEYDKVNIYKYHISPQQMKMALTDGSEGNQIEEVKSIGCGGYHALVSVVGDKVYACGLNNYGQLGLDNVPASYSYLTEVTSLSGKGIMMMEGGVHHSLALTSCGDVLAWGRGDSGQLGCKRFSTDEAGAYSTLPIEAEWPQEGENERIIAISGGGNHNMAVTANYELYTWGYGDMLALGHGQEKDEPTPRKLNLAKAKIKNIEITQVSAGGQHSAIIGKVTTL